MRLVERAVRGDQRGAGGGPGRAPVGLRQLRAARQAGASRAQSPHRRGHDDPAAARGDLPPGPRPAPAAERRCRLRRPRRRRCRRAGATSPSARSAACARSRTTCCGTGRSSSRCCGPGAGRGGATTSPGTCTWCGRSAACCWNRGILPRARRAKLQGEAEEAAGRHARDAGYPRGGGGTRARCRAAARVGGGVDARWRRGPRRTVGRGVAQSGSAPQWGCGGRRFESSHPDQPAGTAGARP